MDRPDGRRVLKFDGAFGPEGCGIALSGDEYEVSVTDLPFCIIRHEKHYGNQPPPVAFFPPPLVPYGTKGRMHFPCPQGGCKGFIQTGAFYKFSGALHNPQRHSRCQT